jgi:hypothetical protein
MLNIISIIFCCRMSDNFISVRSGSTFSSSGGTIHSARRKIVHENYRENPKDYDVALVQVCVNFSVSLYN